MAFPLDDIFPEPRPATFGPRKSAGGGITAEAIGWHTTEASGTTREAAFNTAVWQRTNPGSYNWILYDPASAGANGGALLTVPFLEASGGLATNGSSWSPGRFPILKQLLSPAAYADPNAYILNIAFSGRTADLRANLTRPDVKGMIDVAARLTLWVEAQPWGKDDIGMLGHFMFQTDRSDPSQAVIDAILARYLELKAPDYKALYEAEKAKVEAQAQKIADLMNVIVRKDAALDRIAPKVGELAESVAYARKIA